MDYLNCEDDWWTGDESNSTETLLDSFDGVLDLEEVAIGWEDSDSRIVHLKYFQNMIYNGAI